MSAVFIIQSLRKQSANLMRPHRVYRPHRHMTEQQWREKTTSWDNSVSLISDCLIPMSSETTPDVRCRFYKVERPERLAFEHLNSIQKNRNDDSFSSAAGIFIKCYCRYNFTYENRMELSLGHSGAERMNNCPDNQSLNIHSSSDILYDLHLQIHGEMEWI